MISRRQIISGFAGPIFAIFSPNESIFLGVDYWSGRLFWYLKGCCHGNRFCAKMGQNYLPPALIAPSLRNGMGNRLADECINSSTNCSTSCKNMVKIGSVVLELNRGRKWKLCCDSAEIGRYSFICHTGVLKRIGISQFWFQPVNWQSFLYNSWKFGEIRISDPGVLGERSCRMELIIVTRLSSPMFAMGWGC